MRVAIYDSGVGGLSILNALKTRMPQSQYIFVSDNGGYPYGTKAEAELLERCQRVFDNVVKRFKPDVLIIACNTASTVCLPMLRAKTSVPIVGVVPAVKPAAQLSDAKVIGLLATPATVARKYTQDLIDEFAQGCAVVKIGSSELVDIAENKLNGQSVDLDQVESVLTPFLLHESLDTLVLACTHFPLLIDEIKAVLCKHQRTIALIDSSEAIAKRVQSLLSFESSSGAALNGLASHENLAVFTENIHDPSLINNLKNFGLRRIETISI